MTSIHYRQGSQQGPVGGWIAAVHGNIVLLVENPVAASGAHVRLDGLWRSLTSANGMQATLDELTRGGLSATPSFALVQWEEGSASGPVRAVLRGAVTLITQADTGTSTTDARDVSTWLEQQYAAVSSFELRVGAAADAGADVRDDESIPLPLQSGVAWASRLVVERAQLPIMETPSARTAGASAPAASVPAAPPQTKNPPAWVDPEATVTGLTSMPDAVPAIPSPDATPADAAGEGSYDYLFGETVFRSVEDAAVRDESEPGSDVPAAADSGETDAGDHDGHTIASVDIAKLRAGRKARGTAHPPASPPSPRLYLESSNGSREPLTQPILVGRAPSVSKVSGGRMPRLLTVAGSDQDISRNHAQFAVEGGTVVVTDLHSRNGTMIILPGRPPQQLRQGEPTSVIVGTVIDLGGGVTFAVGEE